MLFTSTYNDENMTRLLEHKFEIDVVCDYRKGTEPFAFWLNIFSFLLFNRMSSFSCINKLHPILKIIKFSFIKKIINTLNN